MGKRLNTWTYNNATEEEKKLYMAGLPQKYWGYVNSNILFTSFHKRLLNQHKRLTDADQNKQWNKLLETPIAPQIICIASAPTDHHAMATSAVLAKAQLELLSGNLMAYKAIRFVNSNLHSWTFDREYPDCSMVVVYNVMDDAPDERLQIVRDYLTSFGTKLRVVVVGSTTGNPIDFMWERLHLEADLYFGSTNHLKHTTTI